MQEEEQEDQKRNYKTRHQVQIVLAEMERQICEGKTDNEIKKFLELKERSYYYFKNKLYKQSLAIQTSKKTEEVIAFETAILKNRLIKVYQHLEQRLTMMNADPTIDDNMADIAVATFEIAKNIMTLEMEGIRALSAIKQNKLLKYANNVYQNIPNYYSPNGETTNNDNSNILQP